MQSLSRTITTLSVLLLLCGALGACGDDDDDTPLDVEGDYTLAVTNRDNGCEFEGWVEGDSATGVRLVLTQDGNEVTGELPLWRGGTRLEYWLGTGASQPEGTLRRNRITLSVYGERAWQQGNCAYTINATIDATLTGDLLEGHIDYTAATNDNPDCGELEGCISRQDFNGTRPPR
jgi:hypothetical protein